LEINLTQVDKYFVVGILLIGVTDFGEKLAIWRNDH